MLLIEKIKETHFSPAEQTVIDYLHRHSSEIDQRTIKEISEKTFVHPSTFIRIAKKLNFSGWSEFKQAYLEEQQYLTRHFESIDPNIPFNSYDSPLTIAQKMNTLEQTTLADTFSLLQNEELSLATNYLYQAEEIKIFTSFTNFSLVQDFITKMRRIGINIHPVETTSEQIYECHSMSKNDCALIISYTGENRLIRDILPILKQKRCPIVALSGIGESTLSKNASACLRITTREKLYSKIGSFTTNTSISYLLNVLYSTIFAKNYQKNLEHLIYIGERYDKRISTAPVMKEHEREDSVRIHDSFFPN